jgi:hypothetical protein
MRQYRTLRPALQIDDWVGSGVRVRGFEDGDRQPNGRALRAAVFCGYGQIPAVEGTPLHHAHRRFERVGCRLKRSAREDKACGEYRVLCLLLRVGSH